MGDALRYYFERFRDAPETIRLLVVVTALGICSLYLLGLVGVIAGARLRQVPVAYAQAIVVTPESEQEIVDTPTPHPTETPTHTPTATSTVTPTSQPLLTTTITPTLEPTPTQRASNPIFVAENGAMFEVEPTATRKPIPRTEPTKQPTSKATATKPSTKPPTATSTPKPKAAAPSPTAKPAPAKPKATTPKATPTPTPKKRS